MKKIIFLFILVFWSSLGEAQQMDSMMRAKGIGKISKENFGNGWVMFKDNIKIKPRDLFNSEFKSHFGLSPMDSMKLIKTTRSKSGIDHFQFQQIYNGILVEGMRYTLHAQGGNLLFGNGDILLEHDIPEIPIKDCYAYKYDELIADIGYKPYRDSGYLVIARSELESTDSKEKYRYMFKVKALKNDKFVHTIYINPETCTVDKIENQIRHGLPSHSGTVQTLYNGTQSVKTYKEDYGWPCNNLDFYHLGAWFKNTGQGGGDGLYGSGPYRLLTESFGTDWCVFVPDKVRPSSVFRDGDNNWDNNNPSTMQATSAFWALQKSFDYFDSEWGITHFGSSNNKLLMMEFLPESEGVNAFFTPQANISGLSANYIGISPEISGVSNTLASLDVIGHEYMHGVIYYTAGSLPYGGEIGAIQESICDIMGNMVQRNVEGYNASKMYTIGEDPIYAGSQNNHLKRSFSDPKSLGGHSVSPDCSLYENGQPDTYLGQFWDVRACDNWGVHGNSGVMNYWFYLLSHGGSGVNDNQFSYNVSGIGIDKASEIVMSLVTDGYILPGSIFSDIRTATIQIAHDEFGACSNEYIQTVKSWNAVGVPSQGSQNFENVVVSCMEVQDMHNSGQTYEKSAVGYLEMGCTIGNGMHTILKSAGNIKLLPGFEYGSGGSFLAEPIPCQ